MRLWFPFRDRTRCEKIKYMDSYMDSASGRSVEAQRTIMTKEMLLLVFR